MAENYASLGNLYELLEVQPVASEGVIKAAYKARAAQVHPDKGGTVADAIMVNKAGTILLDEDKRKKYDAFLREQQEGVIGNYKVLEQIGEGAFGVTYKAKHLRLEELACLKQNIHLSAEDTRLLTKEAKLLWSIHHHSLPTLRDFFTTPDGSCVLAMTYVEGPTLDKIVQKYDSIDPEHVSWITQRLLNALDYLHFHGIVHCDVKPNNIIIKPEEHNAVLVDYGFASLKPRQKTKPEGLTEVFAAPELLELQPPIPQSDLYSLALTMIYSLGGNPVTKQYPKTVPSELRAFFNSFLKPNPLHRASWENSSGERNDLVKELSDLRMKMFGRKSSEKKLEIEV